MRSPPTRSQLEADERFAKRMAIVGFIAFLLVLGFTAWLYLDGLGVL